MFAFVLVADHEAAAAGRNTSDRFESLILNNETIHHHGGLFSYAYHTMHHYWFDSIIGILANIVLIIVLQARSKGYFTVENHLLYRLRMILPDNEQPSATPTSTTTKKLVIKITAMNEAIIKALYFYNDLDYLFFTFLIMVFSMYNAYNILVIGVFIILLLRLYTSMYHKNRNALYYISFVIAFLSYFNHKHYFMNECKYEIENVHIKFIMNHVKHYFFTTENVTRGMANGWLWNMWGFLFENVENYSILTLVCIHFLVAYVLNIVVEFDYITKCHIYLNEFKEYHHFIIGNRDIKDKKSFKFLKYLTKYVSHVQFYILPLSIAFVDLHQHPYWMVAFCISNIVLQFIYYKVYLKCYFIYRALYYNKYKQHTKMINLVKYTILYCLKNLILPFISTCLLALYIYSGYSNIVYYTMYIYYYTIAVLALLTTGVMKLFATSY